MQVAVSPFTRQGIEERLGPDVPAGVEIALLSYVGKLRSGRGAPAFPSFLQNASFEDPISEVELNVGPEVEKVLSVEARLLDLLQRLDRLGFSHCHLRALPFLGVDRGDFTHSTGGHTSPVPGLTAQGDRVRDGQVTLCNEVARRVVGTG